MLTLSEPSKDNIVLSNREGFYVQGKSYAAQHRGLSRLRSAQAWAADTLGVSRPEHFLFGKGALGFGSS